MSERGEYRPIYVVLVHDADYHALTPAAKLVFLHCKLNLGSAGIGVLYAAALAEQTGLPESDIAVAMQQLEAGDWVRVDRNIVWVRNGLRFEPSLSVANPNHREWLRKHVAGLPRLPILDAFRAHYAEWFGAGSRNPSPSHRDGMGDATAINTISSTNTITTRNSRTARKPRRTSVEARWPHFPRESCDRLYAAWSALGKPPYSTFRNAFGPLFPESPPYSLDQLERAITLYIGEAKGRNETQYCTPRKFVEAVGHWVEQATPILQRDPRRAFEMGIAGAPKPNVA